MAGVQGSPASAGFGEGGEVILVVGPPGEGGVDGIARGNGAAAMSPAKVAASSGTARAADGGVAVRSFFLTDSRSLSLPDVLAVPEGTLDPSQSPAPPSKSISLVEVHVNDEGEAMYRFNKSAPSRRGKWSRMEEEYAKRLVQSINRSVDGMKWVGGGRGREMGSRGRRAYVLGIAFRCWRHKEACMYTAPFLSPAV